MITIKLPYKYEDIEFENKLLELQKAQSNLIRICFNRFKDEYSENAIRKYLKEIGLYNINGCWFQNSAIKEALFIYKRTKDLNNKVIFGGKSNLKRYLKGIISKEEYKNNKLSPLSSIGEAGYKGNRYFTLDIIENNQIIFKPSKGTKYILSLPKLRSNYRESLYKLETLAKEKKIPYSIKLTKSFICINFEEFKKEHVEYIPNRIIAIDLNPNRIGYSVCDYKIEEQYVIESGCIEYKGLNTELHLRSNDPKKLYQNNKRIFEYHQVIKFLIGKAIHFKCQKFSIEKLDTKAKDHGKGKVFNKFVNNNWNKDLFIKGIKKYCNIYGIEFIEVLAYYSSIIGNTIYSEYPDPICASLEINRRGMYRFQKDKFYPKIPSVESLNELWKQTLSKSFVSWKEISTWIKESKVKYRLSLDDFKDNLMFSSLIHYKSDLFLYKFIKDNKLCV